MIAATNRDLEDEIENGNFREDLYWRLNVVALHLAPLRQRKADVHVLVEHFLSQLAEEHGTDRKEVEQRALSFLIGHAWPGNVRELRNVVERIAVMAEGESITVADVRTALQSGSSVTIAKNGEESVEGLREARDAFEREHIQRVLIAHDGRVQEAAEALGIDRTSLWRKMQQLDLE